MGGRRAGRGRGGGGERGWARAGGGGRARRGGVRLRAGAGRRPAQPIAAQHITAPSRACTAPCGPAASAAARRRARRRRGRCRRRATGQTGRCWSQSLPCGERPVCVWRVCVCVGGVGRGGGGACRGSVRLKPVGITALAVTVQASTQTARPRGCQPARLGARAAAAPLTPAPALAPAPPAPHAAPAGPQSCIYLRRKQAYDA